MILIRHNFAQILYIVGNNPLTFFCFTTAVNFIFFGTAFGENAYINQNTTWESGCYTYEEVHVTNGATLIFNGKVILNVQNLSIDQGSSISADGQGYPVMQGPGTPQSGPGGGSYGGNGGSAYGSALIPEDLGSGGGGKGEAGGGAIKLIVTDTLTLDGLITANGKGPGHTCESGGGGSGGSIYVVTHYLTGSGSFTANGGWGDDYTCGGIKGGAGGGGRIAISDSS